MTAQELINSWCDLEENIINTFKNASETFRRNTDDTQNKRIMNLRRLCLKLLQVIDDFEH